MDELQNLKEPSPLLPSKLCHTLAAAAVPGLHSSLYPGLTGAEKTGQGNTVGAPEAWGLPEGTSGFPGPLPPTLPDQALPHS